MKRMMVRHLRRALALMLLVTFAVTGAVAEALNLLLIGVDTLEETAADCTDAMFLMRVDPDQAQIRMASFQRDLLVTVPEEGECMLNAVYSLGGDELLKQTLLENFGVTAERTVTIHVDLLSQMIDQLGGIELQITEEERLALNALLTEQETPVQLDGLQVLNGRQALCYTRIQQTDDVFRYSQRQKDVIEAIARRAAEQRYLDLLKLAIKTLPEIQTDLKIGDVMGLLPIVTKLDSMDTLSAGVPFEDTWQEQMTEDGVVLVPDLELIRLQLNAFFTGEE